MISQHLFEIMITKQTQKIMIQNITREYELVCFCEELVREY